MSQQSNLRSSTPEIVSTISASEWLYHRDSVAPLLVSNVTLVQHTTIFEKRGRLIVGEYGRELPFISKRFFVISDVPSEDIRGEHAHKKLQQFLICLAGRVHTIVDDGSTRQEIILDNPQVGLYLPPMVWGAQYRYSRNSVLMVLASDEYDPADYIRDYALYLDELKKLGFRK